MIDLAPLLVGIRPDDPLGEGRCFGPYTSRATLQVSGVSCTGVDSFSAEMTQTGESEPDERDLPVLRPNVPVRIETRPADRTGGDRRELILLAARDERDVDGVFYDGAVVCPGPSPAGAHHALRPGSSTVASSRLP